MAIKYRPEVDGMRAVAVLSVMLYHLQLPLGQSVALPGGFLGVDVFFVLSGFLITSIIAGEIDKTGRLDIWQFYLRRIRRIIPPLLLVILVSVPVAWAVLLPSEMARFGQSLWAALGFYSNFFWYLTLGEYGIQTGLLQPFLHTWSLAIEEQFYLAYPLLLLAAMRWCRRWLVPLALLGIVGSLAVAQATTWMWQNDLSFYSPVSRVWELLAGALLALAPVDAAKWNGRWPVLRFLPTLGLGAVIASMMVVKLDGDLHPGLATIPTVAGTCAMLAFANPRDPVTRLLALVPMVWIGKLSYSLYLWHYPVYAFARLQQGMPPSWLDVIVWVGLTFALSWAGYRLVERPLRFSMPTRPFLATVAAGAVAVVALPFLLDRLDMRAAPRATMLAGIYGAQDYDNERLDHESWSVLRERSDHADAAIYNHHFPSQAEQQDLWFTPDASRKVLVIGNSHSKDMFNALALNQHRFGGVEFARYGLNYHLPPAQVTALRESPNYRAAEVIAISQRWEDGFEGKYHAFLALLREDGKQVVLINNSTEFLTPGYLPIYDQLVLAEGRALPAAEANRAATAWVDPAMIARNRALDSFARAEGVALYLRHELVCAPGTDSCTQVVPNGQKAFYDYDHWTLDGARHFGMLAAQAGWFRE